MARTTKTSGTRGLILRNGVWYISIYCDRRHYHFSTGCRAKKAAQEDLARARANKRAYIAQRLARKERRGTNFAAWVKEYLALMEREGKRDLRRRGSALKALCASFGAKDLADITRDAVTAYRDRRKALVSPASVNRELAYGSHAFTVAMAKGGAERNPFQGVRHLKEPPGRIRYLLLEEAERLIEAAASWFRPLLLVALETGCRKGELANLQWDEVDFHSGFFTVREAKNGEGRMVPMTSRVEETLRGLMRHLDHPFVFTLPDGQPLVQGWREMANQDATGKPLPRLGYRDTPLRVALARARAAAGIEDFRFHDARHHFGSWLAMSGVDIERRMATMGHRQAQVARRYTHLEPGYIKDAVRLLEDRTRTKTRADLQAAM